LATFSAIQTSYFSYLLNDPDYAIIPNMDKLSQRKFLGITTVGEKGQIVIPAEARAALKLAKGEKLVVMSPHNHALVLVKASQFENMAARFTKHIASVRKMIKKKK